jgi:hypothetical protein
MRHNKSLEPTAELLGKELMTLQEIQNQALQLPISDRNAVGTGSSRISETGSQPKAETGKSVAFTRHC